MEKIPENSKNPKFTLAELKKFDVKEEPGRDDEMRIVKLEIQSTPTVEEFKIARIKKPGDGDYASTKAKYGPLAATDPDRKARSTGQRFSINALLREPLSIEQEEQRAVEARVQATVEELAKKAKEEASRLGYQDGLAKGHEEAFLKFQSEAQARMEGLQKLILELENAKADIFKANERYLMNLVFRICRMVILREVKEDRDYVQRLAVDLIERVGVRDNIKLRISPSDSETIGMMKAGLEKELGALTNLSIETDSQIQAGGISIETQFNAIDASVDRALQGISESLLGKVDTNVSGTG